ncbi:MAG: hypothetical protein LBH47_00440 [Christensenellaceae bacterium]|nr:hypothetical protein [Christensenellaceae bacterium]
MNENIFYIDAKTKVVDFLTTEFGGEFPIKLQNRLMNFLPSMINYEEEGRKYKPTIFFTNNIDFVLKQITNSVKIELYKDTSESEFVSRIKALVPFCSLDWCIYVDEKINEEKTEVRYGIFRTISSIKDAQTEEILFKAPSLQERNNKTFGIFVSAENNWTITMKSIKSREMNINFSFDIKTVNNWEGEIKEFVDASFAKLRTTKKKMLDIKNMYKNVFKNVLRSVNGTLCVIVDADYKKNDGFFDDGTWLPEPINLSKLFLQTNNYNEQKLLTMTNLFIAMLNYDGITLVNNQGEIIAYNVFVEANLRIAGNIIGGARKRAAYTIINSKRKNIVGVYFQSHEGEMFYAPVKQ